MDVTPIPKPHRVVDSEALELYHLEHPLCEICGAQAKPCPHHIKTRGAGGPDEPWNLVSLCLRCDARVHTEADFRRRVIAFKREGDIEARGALRGVAEKGEASRGVRQVGG